MRRPRVAPLMVTMAVPWLVSCTSDFPGPVVEPGHPAHPRSSSVMVPVPPSPRSLQPPFLPLDDQGGMGENGAMRSVDRQDDAATGSSSGREHEHDRDRDRDRGAGRGEAGP